jgi:HK97 family phage major capsid protein
MNLKELRERRAELIAKVENINEAANKEERALTKEELAEIDRALGKGKPGQPGYKPGEIDALDEQLLAGEKIEEAMGVRAVAIANGQHRPGDSDKLPKQRFIDRDGRPVYCLSKDERFQDLPLAKGADPEARVGELIRCAITGNWRNASPSVVAAQREGWDSTGGYLVPEEMMRRVVDLARARSVIMQAGAQTVPMETDRMCLARVTTDPTFEYKAEHNAFTGSDIVFGQLNFAAHLIGTLITSSRELAEDAPNFVEIVESVLAQAFATKLDNIAINGMGSTGPDGMLDWLTTQGIGETGSVGGILRPLRCGYRTSNPTP